MVVNQKRLIRRFIEMTSVDTVSFHERKMADYLIRVWHQLGIDLKEDDAAEKIHGDAGNLFGTWRSASSDEYVLFCGHQDTVQPGIGKKAVVHDDGRITSDGTTVLGADDAAALAIICEAVQELQEEGVPHRNIELFFPVAEEAYTSGSSVFDFTPVKSRIGYCLDCSDRLGSYSGQEPTLISFRFVMKGKAAHAGFEPEKGINALSTAAKAIVRIHQGHPDDHSTLNLGTIHGGTGTNIVPDEVVIEGELRSSVHEDALRIYEETVSVFRDEAGKAGAEFNDEKAVRLFAYHIEPDNEALKRYLAALKKAGIEPYAKPNFGGSDCNVLIRNGIQAICTFNSMHDCHTIHEYAVIDEMVKMTEIVKELMKLD